MRPAIFTRYHADKQRVSASDSDGNRCVLSYPQSSGMPAEDMHRAAANALMLKMDWTGELVGAPTRNGFVFVFAPERK